MAATRFSDGDSDGVSSLEAQQIFSMWARHQGGGEALESGASIEELARAINAPPEEVYRMLDKVRAKKSLRQKTRTVAHSLRWLGVGIVGLAVMGGLFGVGFTLGKNSTHQSPYLQSYYRANPPQGYTVGFDGYSTKGTQPDYGIDNQQVSLEQALQSVVNQMSPAPILTSTSSTVEDVRKAIAETRDIPGVLEFKDAVVSHEDTRHTLAIPVCLISDPFIEPLIRDEQERRVKKLASWLFVEPSDAVSVPAQSQ